jgi:hypothetical protein
MGMSTTRHGFCRPPNGGVHAVAQGSAPAHDSSVARMDSGLQGVRRGHLRRAGATAAAEPRADQQGQALRVLTANQVRPYRDRRKDLKRRRTNIRSVSVICSTALLLLV